MADFNLPELDASIPEPDFFDDLLPEAIDSPLLVGDPLATSSVADIDSVLVADILETEAPNPALKYDDENCEFDEFLVLPDKLKQAPLLNPGAVPEVVPEAAEVGSIPTGNIEEKDKDEDDRSSKSSRSEQQQPTTSATIHFPSVPTPIFTSRRVVIPHESPTKKVDSDISDMSGPTTFSPLIRRGQRRQAQLKRKMSESDEKEEDEEKDGDDKVLPRSRTTSPRGRGGRSKIARYADSKSDRSLSLEKLGATKKYGSTPEQSDEEKAQEENLSQNSFGSGSSQSMFSPVKKPKKVKHVVEEVERISLRSGSSDASLFTVVKGRRTKSTEEMKKKKTIRPGFYEKIGDVILCYHDGQPLRITKCVVKVRKLSREEVEKKYGAKWITKADLQRQREDKVLLEVCIDNVQSAVAAVKGGAKRIELCSALLEGGLTPTTGFLTVVKELCDDIPVFAMIRPRGGDFLYSQDELEVMSRDITLLKQSGADGFVFGVLTEDGEIDIPSNKLLKDMAFPLPCTFHRAFDKLTDPESALEQIIDLGFDRILTSGLHATAHAGMHKIKQLVDLAEGRIIIMPGAGINEKNVAEIVKKTGVTEVHGSASKQLRSQMTVPAPKKSVKRSRGKAKGKAVAAATVKMGATDDDVIKVTDAELVEKIVARANNRR